MVLIGRVRRRVNDEYDVLRIVKLLGLYGVDDVWSSLAIYPNGDVVGTRRALRQLAHQPPGRSFLRLVTAHCVDIDCATVYDSLWED
jgi:hypothetical protein